MTILSIYTDTTGQIDVSPRRVKIITTDNLATITTAGYLAGAYREGYIMKPTDVFDIIYSYSVTSGVGTYGVFTVSITSNVPTLVQWANPGDVLLPVVSGDLAMFNGTSGQIEDSNILASNVMVLNASNTMTGTGRIISVKANGTEAANAVTASGMAGLITTSSLTTAGAGSYAITWTNTYISSTSSVLLTIAGGTNTTENITLKVAPGSGTATLTIYNNTASTALNGTILISYLVI